MCNMAAYAGKRRAAPILFEMIREQEALGGGHYTGIATISDGKIYYAKVCGASAKLAERTGALDLPGTVGIAHSRTPGIDADSWAQPFLSFDKRVIYCGNGILGRFAGTNFCDYYMDCRKRGMSFDSFIPHPVQYYTTLPDGGCVHGGELISNLLADLTKQGKTLEAATAEVLQTHPEEVCQLALSVEEPETVTAARVNMSLHWGHRKGEYFLATSALALDAQKLDWIAPVPRAASLTMSAEDIHFTPMDAFDDLLAPVTPWGKIHRRLDELMATGAEYTVADLADRINDQWPEDKLNESVMMTYEYLRENLHAGRLGRRMTEEPGSGAGLTAPKYRFFKTDRF